MIKAVAKNLFNTLASRFGAHHKNSDENRLWILMYHRILPEELAAEYKEEPGMYVTPETFQNHLQWLQQIMAPIRLEDWQSLKKNKQGKKYFAITFDDGWKDNFDYAFPILKKMNIPATIFLVSDYMGTSNIFWPNRLAALLPRLGDFSEQSPELSFLREKFSLSKQTDFTDIASIIAGAKNYSDTEINEWLDTIDNQNDRPPQLLDWQQIDTMHSSGVFDIGAHTRHHIRLLDHIDEQIISDQILGSKEVIESKLNKPSTLFCYPNGDYSEYAGNLVKDNFSAAVTTQTGINKQQQNLHELMRVGVHEDVSANKRDFYARLSCWR